MQPVIINNADYPARQKSILSLLSMLPLLFLIALPNYFAFGDELVLDESCTEMHSLGDFNVSTFIEPVDLSEQAIMTQGGEIDAGQLYSYFKSRGLKEVTQLNLCLEVDSGIRADHALNGIELVIQGDENMNSQIFRLGDDNILKLPGYEASDMKPEAAISLDLGYNFMEEFDENSTEKIKFMVDGKEVNSLPMQVAYLAPPSDFSYSRLTFLVAFVTFWIFVFLILFRTTLPRDRDVASSPA